MKSKKEGLRINKINTEVNEYKWLPILIFFYAFFLYANTISFDYACDDGRYTYDNVYVQNGLSDISNLITKGSQEGCSSKSKYVPDYRPVVLISFAVENALIGNSPKSNHFFNVLLYSMLCTLLFLFLKKIFKEYSIWLSLLITLLFISHPIHTEVVANIKSRDELLSMLFGLITLIQIFKYLEVHQVKHLLFGLLAFLFSLLSKETGFVFLGIIPIVVYYKSNLPIKKNILISILLMVVSAFALLIRWRVIGNVINKNDYFFIWNPLIEAPNFSIKIATALSVISKSILMLFFPLNLSWDYSYNEIPFSKWSELNTILGTLIYITLIVISFIGIKRKVNISMAISIYLIASIITANIFFVSPIIFSERSQFVSSLGFCILFPFLIGLITKEHLSTAIETLGKKSKFITLAFVFLYSIKTISRSADWKNDESLYLSGVKTSPNSCRTHFALASLYYDRIATSQTNEEMQKNLDHAIYEYRKALKIYPKYTSLYYNLGVSYFYKKDYDSSAYMYNNALKLDSTDFKNLNNYAYVTFVKKEYKKSLELYKKALSYGIGDNLIPIYLGAGFCSRELSDYTNAKLFFKKVLQIDPNNKDALNSINTLDH